MSNGQNMAWEAARALLADFLRAIFRRAEVRDEQDEADRREAAWARAQAERDRRAARELAAGGDVGAVLREHETPLKCPDCGGVAGEHTTYCRRVA